MASMAMLNNQRVEQIFGPLNIFELSRFFLPLPTWFNDYLVV